MKTGQLVVAGDMDITNPGPEPVVLDSARPLQGSRGLVLGPVRVVTIDHEGIGDSLHTRRPSYPAASEPVHGYRLAAGDTPDVRVKLLIGIRAVRPGQWMRGVVIAYHAGGHRYAAVYPYLVRLCAWPHAPLTHSCQGLPTELLHVSAEGERE